MARGWQYAGYKMTIFSASEEKWVENDILHAKMYFNMPYALKTAGGEVTIETLKSVAQTRLNEDPRLEAG